MYSDRTEIDTATPIQYFVHNEGDQIISHSLK